MKTYFCWRCNQKMPFLEEDEWQQISPGLSEAYKAIKAYRIEHDCDLQTAKLNCKTDVAKMFEKLTGIAVDMNIINHHRLKDWGKECADCGHLLRTSRAKYCANCGLETE